MAAQTTNLASRHGMHKFLSVAVGALFAAAMIATPVLAQSRGDGGHRGGGRGGDHGRGGHSVGQAAQSGASRGNGGWQRGGNRSGAVNGGYRGNRGDWNRGDWNRGNWNRGGWDRGYGGRINTRWHGGWNRPWRHNYGYRYYGPAFVGFGYYTDPYWARPYIGLSAWNWAAYDAMTEAQIRAQQSAFIAATSAPLSDPVVWNDGSTSGTVTPLREGQTDDGRLCREFQQEITIAGKRTQAFGTACQQTDGSWQIVDQADVS